MDCHIYVQKTVVGLLILFLWVQGAAQSLTPAFSQIDSLRRRVREAPSPVDKIEGYGKLCMAFASTVGDVKVSHQYADSIQALAGELALPGATALADYYQGLVARYEGSYRQALHYLHRYAAYCKVHYDSLGSMKTLLQLSVVHEFLGNYDKSLAMGYQAVDFCVKKKLYYDATIAYMQIGNVLVQLKKMEEAVKIYEQASAQLQFCAPTALDVKMAKLRVTMNVGNAHYTLGQHEQARKAYDESLRMSIALGAMRTLGTCFSSIGEILNAQGMHDSACVYHHKALHIREQSSQKDKIVLSLLRLGETYLYLNENTHAITYLEKALARSVELRAKAGIRDAAENLSKVYAGKKDFPRALQYHQVYAAMKDSVLNEETARRIDELQTKYETEEKDRYIILLAREKQMQEKEVVRQVAQKRVLWAGIVFILILAVLAGHLFLQRTRNQKLLSVKNAQIREATFRQQMSELEMKALRAQINPHFLFNCMNSINRMILNNDTTEASAYLTKLSKLIRLILENTETPKVSLANELMLLESYIQLEELRFKGKITYSISVDGVIDRESVYIPSMVIQPFVENAIWHGLIHKEGSEKGKILIDIQEVDDRLICTVEDNGVGRARARMLRENSVLKGKSMGMQITKERLELLNSAQWQVIQITDLMDNKNIPIGTRVEINIPIS